MATMSVASCDEDKAFRPLVTGFVQRLQQSRSRRDFRALSGARYRLAFLREAPIAIMVEDGTAALLRQPAPHWPSADR
jgi:hypothetical protein